MRVGALIGEQMPDRRASGRARLAAIAVAVAAVTAVTGAALGGTADHAILAVALLASTIAALRSPSWIAVQVVAGQLLAARLLLGTVGITTLHVLPLVAGVIATAELLAAVGRLDSPVELIGGGELRRAAVAAGLGAAVFAAVALTGSLPGPSGLAAVAIASAACVALAILLVTRGRGVAGRSWLRAGGARYRDRRPTARHALPSVREAANRARAEP